MHDLVLFRSGARRSAVYALSLLALLGTPACDGEPPVEDGFGGETQRPSAESIEFLERDGLRLEPGETGVVDVQVLPPGFHSVSFSLIANASDRAFDGFLEAASVVTDARGRARNVIHAPSQSAVFTVRASVQSLVATRTVSVSKEGFAALEVVPLYGGKREVDEWIVDATPAAACSGLESHWNGGALSAEGPAPVLLEGAPVGPRLALVLRAARYISGCVEVEGLSAGETRRVQVTVSDRPMQLSSGTFDIVLDIEQHTDPFVDLLEDAALAGAVDYAREAQSDGEVVLLDMTAAVPAGSARNAFRAAAQASDFTQLILDELDSKTSLRDEIRQILLRAAMRVGGPGAFTGRAVLDDASSTFLLDTAAGVPAQLSGFLGSAALSLAREPSDRLVLETELEFQPTRFLGSIAESVPDASSDPGPLEALGSRLDCAELAVALTNDDTEEPYPGCDVECAESLCDTALESGWSRARSTAKALTTLRIGMSAAMALDDAARPIGLDGTWVGSLDASEVSLSGTVSSELTEAP